MSTPTAEAPSADFPPELPMESAPLPIRVVERGKVVVGLSRVCFDLVVFAYQNGSTAEDIVRSYDTLSLADVHEAIAYYLRNREAVEAYLERRDREVAELRAQIGAEFPRRLTKEILQERLLAREKTRAETR